MTMKKYLPYQDVKNKLLSIPDAEHRGFLCLTYAVMGRVGEVLRHRLDQADAIEWINPPIRAEDMRVIRTRKGHKLISISVLTEKVNQIRNVPVFPQTEWWLIQPFWKRKQEIKKGFLYNYSTRWGEKIFEKYFGTQDIHSLRHWRITHLRQGEVTGKPIDSAIVARMAGHTNLNSQRAYDHSVIFDFADDLIDNYYTGGMTT